MSDTLSEQLHWTALLRLCHKCMHISEGEKEVLKCERCEKAFLPLTPFSEILKRAGKTKMDIGLSAQSEIPFLIPLQGLVVFW